MKFILRGRAVRGAVYEHADRPKREPMLPDHRKTAGWCGPERNWPPDQTRSRKARKVAKLRKERR